jgi:hypothetical protein
MLPQDLEHLERLLDEALAETFPASDPVAITIALAPEPVGAVKRAASTPLETAATHPSKAQRT